ncbi:MAG TPA: alpha/beta hydrolase [Daejeonella sp.]|nr:alpha/beta hydrolase [Daejeonella sp.]
MLVYLAGILSSFSAAGLCHRDIAYLNPASGTRNLLDVYYPPDIENPKDVLVFIHGGSWNSGKKDAYWWLGRNFASKNVVAITINYRLAPDYQFQQMAADCASALKWVKHHIAEYGGNADRIFVMGHSAGGHLAALINADPRFFEQQELLNPIRGVILNDGFGLDMHEYLLQAPMNKQTQSFLKTFSANPEYWKKGSPFTYFDRIRHPFLILVGEKTYPAIKIQSKRFFEMLSAQNRPVQYQVISRKKHVGMISQMIFANNELYKTILDFMQAN